MATLIKSTQKHYDVLAEALTADGRVVKKVEARASDLADVAEAFKLAAAEAQKAHVTPARIRLTASRAGISEIVVTDDIDSPLDPLACSALLDGKTKVDAPPPPERVITWDQIRRHAIPVQSPWTNPPGATCDDCGRKGLPCPHILFTPGDTTQDVLEEADRQAPDLAPFSAVRVADSTQLRDRHGNRAYMGGMARVHTAYSEGLKRVVVDRIAWIRRGVSPP